MSFLFFSLPFYLLLSFKHMLILMGNLVKQIYCAIERVKLGLRTSAGSIVSPDVEVNRDSL